MIEHELIIKIIIFTIGYILGGLSVYLVMRGKMSKKYLKKEEFVSYVLIVMWIAFQGISFFNPEFALDWIFNVVGFGVIGHVLGIKLPLPNLLKK